MSADNKYGAFDFQKIISMLCPELFPEYPELVEYSKRFFNQKILPRGEINDVQYEFLETVTYLSCGKIHTMKIVNDYDDLQEFRNY